MKKWLPGVTTVLLVIMVMASCSKSSGPLTPTPTPPPPTVKITLIKEIQLSSDLIGVIGATTDNKSNLWMFSETTVFEINPDGLIKTDTISISNIGCIGDTIYGLINQVGLVALPENKLLLTRIPIITYIVGHPLKDLTTAEVLDSEYVIADAKYRSITLVFETDGKDLFLGTTSGIIDMGTGEIEYKGKEIDSFDINNDTIYSIQYANQTMYGVIGNNITFPISFSMRPNIMSTNENVIIQLDKEIDIYNHKGLLLYSYVFNNESQDYRNYIVYSILTGQTIYCLFNNGDFYILELES